MIYSSKLLIDDVMNLLAEPYVIIDIDNGIGENLNGEFMFDHTCNFRIPNDGVDVEVIELEFIDFGVEEVFEDEDGVLLYAPFENFGAIQKELENRSLEILSSGFERIPQVTKQITTEQQMDVLKLIEKLEEDDDVQNVYHGLDIQE